MKKNEHNLKISLVYFEREGKRQKKFFFKKRKPLMSSFQESSVKIWRILKSTFEEQTWIQRRPSSLGKPRRIRQRKWERSLSEDLSLPHSDGIRIWFSPGHRSGSCRRGIYFLPWAFGGRERSPWLRTLLLCKKRKRRQLSIHTISK